MARHRVIWEIDVDEDTHRAAGVAAFRAMRDPESTATVFSVQHPDGRVSQFDLQSLSEQVRDELETSPRFGSEISKLLRRMCDAAIAAAAAVT